VKPIANPTISIATAAPVAPLSTRPTLTLEANEFDSKLGAAELVVDEGTLALSVVVLNVSVLWLVGVAAGGRLVVGGGTSIELEGALEGGGEGLAEVNDVVLSTVDEDDVVVLSLPPPAGTVVTVPVAPGVATPSVIV